MRNPNFATWTAWLGATLIAALVFTSYAYTNFETKDEAKDTKTDIVKALDEIKGSLHEINNKVDAIPHR